MNKSFTLIEILVVIVVIGALSAFILVGISSITSKANITKTQAFLNSMDNSLLISRSSQWKFDELTTAINNSTTVDSWGGNTATLSTGDALEKLRTDCPYGKCIYFDGTDDILASSVFTNSITADLTFGGWLKTSVAPAVQDRILDLDQSGLTGIQICMSTEGAYLLDNSGGPTNSIVGPTGRSNGTWHHVMVTRAGTTYKLYINGVYIGTTAGTVLTYVRVYIGGGGGYRWDGTIDDVRVYGAAMSTSQIQQNYYLGLNSLFKNNGITLAEYNQRLIASKNE
jgi:prepilin-type N-terminal cleavage/methylation domain-containing protein